MKKYNKQIMVVSFFLLGVVFLGNQGLEAKDFAYEPLTTLPGFFTAKTPFQNPADLVSGAYTLAIGIASVLAVLVIMWGGIKYIMSATPYGKGEGKQDLQNAFLGMVVLLGAYILLRTINIDLVKRNVVFPDAPENNLGVLVTNQKAAEKAYSEQIKKIREQIAEKNAIDKAITEGTKNIEQLENDITIAIELFKTNCDKNTDYKTYLAQSGPDHSFPDQKNCSELLKKLQTITETLNLKKNTRDGLKAQSILKDTERLANNSSFLQTKAIYLKSDYEATELVEIFKQLSSKADNPEGKALLERIKTNRDSINLLEGEFETKTQSFKDADADLKYMQQSQVMFSRLFDLTQEATKGSFAAWSEFTKFQNYREAANTKVIYNNAEAVAQDLSAIYNKSKETIAKSSEFQNATTAKQKEIGEKLYKDWKDAVIRIQSSKEIVSFCAKAPKNDLCQKI